MAEIVTRAGKGSPLTNNEVDSNFINLNSQADTSTSDIATLQTSKADQTSTGIVNDSAMYYNTRTISQNVTVGSTENVMSVGPMTIADGYTVTISDGGEWVIV